MVTYKKELKSCFSVQMDSPGSIYNLCDLYGCSLENLTVKCLFCNCVLSYEDILSFAVKSLRVVVRGDTFYAACVTCLQLSAVYEQRVYCQCMASASYLKYLCKGNYCELNVRCLRCIKRLDLTEVLECLENEEDFYLVRCIWRAQCRLCKGQNAWSSG